MRMSGRRVIYHNNSAASVLAWDVQKILERSAPSKAKNFTSNIAKYKENWKAECSKLRPANEEELKILL